mgnify:CR=1 FL=1|jgi:hypothetical protein
MEQQIIARGKRKMKNGLLYLGLVLFLTGCSSKNTDLKEPDNFRAESSAAIQPDETTPEGETAISGTYAVPEGWSKADEYFTEEVAFYIADRHEGDDYPDNISISFGMNRYSAEEHTAFRDAIVQQLLMQLDGVDAQLNGDGTYTEQDYVVYIFTIEEADGVITKQYYIVKDYGYCLVHVTNFSGAKDVFEAAQDIVDSFVWADNS